MSLSKNIIRHCAVRTSTYLVIRLSNADAVVLCLGHAPVLVAAIDCHVFCLCLCLGHFVASLPDHVLCPGRIGPIRVVCVSLSYLNPIHELAYQLTLPVQISNEQFLRLEMLHQNTECITKAAYSFTC